jgi:hypothetical protein
MTHDCKTGEAVFYDILCFIAYYPELTQLGFILSIKQSCFKKIVALGAALELGAFCC